MITFLDFCSEFITLERNVSEILHRNEFTIANICTLEHQVYRLKLMRLIIMLPVNSMNMCTSEEPLLARFVSELDRGLAQRSAPRAFGCGCDPAASSSRPRKHRVRDCTNGSLFGYGYHMDGTDGAITT